MRLNTDGAVGKEGLYPHLAKRDTPNFLHAALDRIACAPFFKERRRRLAEPTNLDRKLGDLGHPLLLHPVGYSLENRLLLRCPRCFGSMISLPECLGCRFVLACEQGVWKALLPVRAARYERFIRDYESIRAAEGRGSIGDDYYLALPYRDLSGRLSSQWAVRARTFRYIEGEILPRMTPLRVLDLGAGNGWLSYRLANQGHLPVAIDLLTNDQDGLGAARHYERRLGVLFPRFQAELDNLPFADSQFDVAIFNASFHYSENYEKTFAEALRCVRAGGTVIIADTPWYPDERSGLAMLEERRALFIKRYGFASDELKSCEYLTDQRLKQLERWFLVRWQIHEPYYGLRWQMRPLVAQLRRARKPSRFKIYTAKVAK